MIYSPDGLMRYNDSVAIVDDMPLLSQWIKKPRSSERGFLEAPPRFELGVKVLQTSALPLGYGAILERVTRLELATSTLARWRSTR